MIVLRVFNGLFALVFAFAAVMQYNDPDPLPWITIYFFSFAACIAWETGWLHRLLPLPLVGVATVWAFYIGLSLELEVPVAVALRDWGMHIGGAEELRETIGLSLVALWMGVLTLAGR